MPQRDDSKTGNYSRTAAFYAGIGSRMTPPNVLRLMQNLGKTLAHLEFTLRSGGSPGADLAFESGCDEARGRKEIFLPWKGFGRNTSPLYLPSPEAFALAETIHPAWRRCSPAAKKLHARNCHQILGADLGHPVSFVFFWAPEEEGIVQGGTATAVNLARSRSIPVFNLWKEPEFTAWNSFFEEEKNLPLRA